MRCIPGGHTGPVQLDPVRLKPDTTDDGSWQRPPHRHHKDMRRRIMKRLLAIALVIGMTHVGVASGQTAAAQSDVVKADQALTQALQSGDRAAAEKMLDG